MHLLKKNVNFNKNEKNLKMENPTYIVLERQTLCFISYNNRKLKVEHDELELAKEKRAFFVPCILLEGIFFKICVLFQCIVY